VFSPAQDTIHASAAHASDSLTAVRRDSVVAHKSHKSTATLRDSLQGKLLNPDSISDQQGWMRALPVAGSDPGLQGSYGILPHKKPPAPFQDLFKGHELKVIHSAPESRTPASPDWFFPILLGVFLIYAALRVFYTRFFGQMLRAFVNNNLTNQIVRDENVLVQRASIYLSIVFNVILALFLYLVSIRLGWELGGIGPGFVRFLFFSILVSATYALKFLILKISGWLFGADRETAIYIFNIFLINNILGIALMPLIALLAYNPVPGILILVRCGVILISAAYLYRISRGILAGISMPGFSPLYLFLYLCTLEIAPLLVLIRLIAR
jgi:hypothetical protein